MIVALCAALVTAGCGDDSSASSDEITVETGSLSKVEFTKRADAICNAVRTKFGREYTAFARQKQPQDSRASQEEFLSQTIETIVVPNYEKGMIARISTLGAPSEMVEEVSTFLNAVQKRLDEFEEKPTEITRTAFPFAEVSKLAQAAGLEACSESFG